MRSCRPAAFRLSLLALVGAFPLAACSLLVDTTGLGGGDSDSTETPIVPGDEASARGDAGSTADGSPNETDAGTDAPASLCIDAGAICDDFDQGTLGDNWEGSEKANATMALGDGLSLPHGFRVQLTSSSDSHAFLYKGFEPGAKVGCDFDMRVDGSMQGKEIDFFAFNDSAPDPKSHSYYFAYGSGSWLLGEYAERSDGTRIDRTSSASTPKFDTWMHVRFELSGTKMSLWFDGVSASILNGLSPTSNATRRDLEFGVPYAETATATITYDNVRCELLP